MNVDPKDQARKFLEQLRVVQRENAALWEQIIDPASPSFDPGAAPLRAEYERLRNDLAVSERERKKAERVATEMRRRIEAAGLDPDTAPKAATKSQLKDAVQQAIAKLRKVGGGGTDRQLVDEALSVLERRAS